MQNENDTKVKISIPQTIPTKAEHKLCTTLIIWSNFLLALLISKPALGNNNTTDVGETLPQIKARLLTESTTAYRSSPFSRLSTDYFCRFSRDPDARPLPEEIMIDSTWKILLYTDAQPLTELMSTHLTDFLRRCMHLSIPVEKQSPDKAIQPTNKAIVLIDSGGGDHNTHESFTISVKLDQVLVCGRDTEGLRSGIVKLVDLMGFRQGPILKIGQQIYTPRIPLRVGKIPWLGSHRELVFMGYNAVILQASDSLVSYSLYEISTSNAIPELNERKKPEVLEKMTIDAKQAQRYGLKVYFFLDTQKKFPAEHPVFKNHPEIRGPMTWKADGESSLCTEHPLVRRYLTESIRGLFKLVPGLEGVTVIVGGEGFYHCFMRPYGAQKGHTTCQRCEPLGAETVVSNLCNYLANAAGKVNPNAVITAWPYSAEFVWSVDKEQLETIKKLKPGTAILTEIEKDQHLQKPEGVVKHIWDYSIDFIGPSKRAERQIKACHDRGIDIYLKNDPELGFEAPRLPHIPCLDRWADRADALVCSGANGAWVFAYFRPCYGTSAAEIGKFFWWDPVPEKDELLENLAARIAGKKAGPLLRKAWKYTSDAIDWSPELPPYYTGPYYLGPAHPMCADRKAKLPKVFYGRHLFRGEVTDAEGLILRPTFFTSPSSSRSNAPVFTRFYRRMEELLKKAVIKINKARLMVAPRHHLTFNAEASPIRWFYHTARTHANFYESCRLRDQLLNLAAEDSLNQDQLAKASQLYQKWQLLLLNEKANTIDALPVVEADMRLDFYYGGDHTFPHAADMIRAKLKLLEHEINVFLPSLANKLTIKPD